MAKPCCHRHLRVISLRSNVLDTSCFSPLAFVDKHGDFYGIDDRCLFPALLFLVARFLVDSISLFAALLFHRMQAQV